MTPNVIPLETDREIASFRAARDEHWQLFAERRLIEYLDRRQDIYRFTLTGAILVAGLTVPVLALRAMTKGRVPGVV